MARIRPHSISPIQAPARLQQANSTASSARYDFYNRPQWDRSELGSTQTFIEPSILPKYVRSTNLETSNTICKPFDPSHGISGNENLKPTSSEFDGKQRNMATRPILPNVPIFSNRLGPRQKITSASEINFRCAMGGHANISARGIFFGVGRFIIG
ncbi:hypothetical protein ACLOJK_004165 [Asimina triloba]